MVKQSDELNLIRICTKQGFSQFASWKRNHNKYSSKKFVNSEFGIRDWWNYLMNRTYGHTIIDIHFVFRFVKHWWIIIDIQDIHSQIQIAFAICDIQFEIGGYFPV